MVEGLGVDVVEIDRVKSVVDRWGDHFLRKIFTDKEIAYSLSKRNSVQHLAARFAVKEAVAKALATGWQGGFRWKDIEVGNDASGKPTVALGGELGTRLAGANIHVSISHSDSVVVGVAIVER
jgi:holo-[acyl-carrier protein] synthase